MSEAGFCSTGRIEDSRKKIISALPDDHALYYGFSRFAIELNEILDSEKDFLPATDTRLRPDQRYLEVSNSI